MTVKVKYSYLEGEYNLITYNIHQFNFILKQRGHTKRKFIGMIDVPSKSVVKSLFQNNKDFIGTIDDWFGLIRTKDYKNNLYYGEFLKSTFRCAVSALVKDKTISKIKVNGSNKRLYQLAR